MKIFIMIFLLKVTNILFKRKLDLKFNFIIYRWCS